MLHACFDTSTNTASFLLFKDDEEVLNISRECVKGASKLLPLIDKSIQESGFKVKDIDRWSVGIGPGSFTGMRVGISYVKGICFASAASFRGINSGYGFIFNLVNEQNDLDHITILHDGRRQEVICNSFSKSNGLWTETGTEVVKILELEERVGNKSFITNMSADLFPENLHGNINFVDSINSAFFNKVPFNTGLSLEQMDASCEPIYVRPPVFVQPKSK